MQIIEVQSRKDLKEFLTLPEKIYAQNSTYVVPPRIIMKMQLGKNSPKRKLYLLKDNGKTVARLAAKIHSHAGQKALHFGFFESYEIDSKHIQNLFMQAHQSLAPELEFKGPFHFRMEDPFVGTLVQGYDKDPYFLMSYNMPYYDKLIKAAGFGGMMDLLTYEIGADTQLPADFVTPEKDPRKEGFTVRCLNMKNLRQEAYTIARIFNDALSENWGYEEFLDDQIGEMIALFKLFVDPRVVLIAEYKGEAVGCLLMLPNVNPILKVGKGRLTPKLLFNYLTKRKKMNSIRGYALGVKKGFHGKGIGSLLTAECFEVGRKLGYYKCEISWVLSNNDPMNQLAKAMGGKPDKIYRIYQKPALNAKV